MVTELAVVPPEVVVKNGVWPKPAELVDTESVTAVPLLVTGLPRESCTWTAKGPTPALVPTVWLPATVEVKANLLAGPTTMVKPFGVAPVTPEPLTVAPANVIVGVPSLVSE